MAFIFGDSFGHYLTLSQKWDTVSAASFSITTDPTIVLAPGISGASLAGSSSGYIHKTLPTTYETFVAGTWFRPGTDAYPSGGGIIMAFMDGTTEHVSVRYNQTGNVTFTRNGTVLATSANTLSAGTWVHVEVKVTIGDAADSPSGRYEVRVNGTATGWIADSGTGQDTRSGGNKSISGVRLQSEASTGANGHAFAHFYFLDTSGAVANDFLGPCRFEVLYPTGVGNANAWTPNYADNWRNVADTFADSDSTFNQSATAGQKDKFTMSDVVSGTVHAVQAVLYARQDAGAARTVRPLTRISGTDYNGTSFAMAGSYVFYTDPMTLSPATSAQWTDTEVNGAEFGYELVS